MEAGTEGLIVKTLKDTYEPSKRSSHWLKLKKDYMVGKLALAVPWQALLITCNCVSGCVRSGAWVPRTGRPSQSSMMHHPRCRVQEGVGDTFDVVPLGAFYGKGKRTGGSRVVRLLGTPN